jgi:steroid delta-isomerase-like uncharacterized protein
MTPQENKLLVRRFFDRAFVEHDLDAAADMLARDYYLHDPSHPVFSGGPESFKDVQQEYEGAIQNHHLSIEDQLADGDKVITRWTMTGRQCGDLPGIPNQGKNFLINGITITRIDARGRIAEEWQVWDDAGLKRQLEA